MSRTYRRAQDGYCSEYWSATEWVDIDGFHQRIKKEGKELKKALAIYHSDHDYNSTPTRWWKQNEWQSFRSKAKQELIRWIKDEEYEVQIRNNPRWPWWD